MKIYHKKMEKWNITTKWLDNKKIDHYIDFQEGKHKHGYVLFV